MNLDISKIKSGYPGISVAQCSVLYENCVVCLSRNKHNFGGTSFEIIGDKNISAILEWENIFNDQLDRTYAEQTTATNFGAVGISVLLALELTDYTVVGQAAIGTGIDYWLGHEEGLFFQNSARLEISGIFSDPTELNNRFNRKIRQTSPSDSTKLPAYVSVVEFSKPIAKFGLKK